ncbi:dnaJ homolog subfamily C member 17-like isoform X1 [Mytilus galloprovincialis]|uniref:DnaJ homolog subfamily C member 17 n=1 Tax=Mytilus galloprovincialis TaxID=29158 RepID=A0A8B6GBM4_MYTGA|nr:DnaJ homolog subfamily C member 17 [Mytilus galloprovincialis]VDI61776.1 DnaJ homolog subfamily C member 17 [Mytilus galloprovincialis]
MASLDINKLDLYAILDVSEEATEKELVKAYRKRALKCHPDKNPDDPNAAELFHKLSKALELLTDPAARAAYDKAQKAKKAAEKRHRELDKKRQKLKEDLELREGEVFKQKETDDTATRNLAAEVERLRKEGSRLLEEEQNLLKEQIKKGNERIIIDDVAEEIKTPKLKIKWKAKKGDDSNGGYSYDVLHNLLHKYGDVLNLIISSKRNGSGIVEFKDRNAASMAAQFEKGLSENPLTFIWLDGQVEATTTTSQPTVVSSDDTDFESVVLRKMRQAEERKRLIEQMKEEDGNS